MTGKSGETRPKRTESPEARRERLAAELRANLLKRKAQSRARESTDRGHDQRGQTGS
jgi:hypothetical protein